MSSPSAKMELPPPRTDTSKAPAPKRGGGGILSHLFAGVVGGALVAGGVWAVSQGYVPNISLADAETTRALRLVQARTAELDRAVRGQGRGTGLASTGDAEPQQVNELRARLDSLVQSIRNVDQGIQNLAPRVDAMERRPSGGGDTQQAAQLGAQQAETARQISAVASRVDAMARELEALNRAQTERVADARSAALTLALTNLKRAVSEGKNFGSELAAVETLAPGKLPVSQLATVKDGVPTLAELQREFDEPSRKAIEAFYRGNSGSLVGEVFSRARAAIQVRPAGGTGNSIESVIARMSASLKAGNVQEALSNGEALQGEAREQLRPWIEKAQKRVTAEEVIRKTDQDLLAALTKQSVRR